MNLYEYISQVIQDLTGHLSAIGFTVAHQPEAPARLETPYLLIRPLRATRRDMDTSWAEMEMVLYWSAENTRQTAGAHGMVLAYQLYSFICLWAFATEPVLEVGVVEPQDGYTAYAVTWRDIVDHDYSIAPPGPDYILVSSIHFDYEVR